MVSDLSKHPDTEPASRNPALVMLGGMAATNGDRREVVRFIDGFN